jgi:hypothetical protein
MKKNKIKQIQQYCQKASAGPWTRNPEMPKMITAKADKDYNFFFNKWDDICKLVGDSHIQNWHNHNFICKARNDLPALAEFAMGLVESAEETDQLKGQVAELAAQLSDAKIQVEELQTSFDQAETELARCKEELEKSERHLELFTEPDEYDEEQCGHLLGEVEKIEMTLIEPEEREENSQQEVDEKPGAADLLKELEMLASQFSDIDVTDRMTQDQPEDLAI